MESKQIFERNDDCMFLGSPWLGATVRLKNGKRTATVVSDNVIIGNRRVGGGLKLDKPLGGFRYWNVSDLEMVAQSKKCSNKGCRGKQGHMKKHKPWCSSKKPGGECDCQESPKANEPEQLKPCPLCGSSNLYDKEFGISCLDCGLWLGDGTLALSFGGHIKLWNMRA